MNISVIDKLIIKCCPNGVNYKQLGEICYSLKKNTLKQTDLIKNGMYPVVNSGKELYGYYSSYNNEGDAFVIASRGEYAGFVTYMKDKFWAGGLCYPYTSKCNMSVLTKFIFYYLKNKERFIMDTLVARGGIPALNKGDIDKFKIPVPPMPVQEEIVKILDTYSELEAELEAKLEAELDARKKQYEYHLNQLLSFDKNDKDIKFMPLGEIGTFIKGNGLQKKDFTDSGVGCIHYGQIYTYYGTYTQQTKSFVSEELAKKLKKAQKGDLIIATTSENVEDVGKAVAWLGNESICIGGHSTVFHHNQNPKYMAYLFQTEIFFKQKQKVAKGVKVIDISDKAMSKFKFGFPSIEEQERIVSILDELNKLINEISDSLQAEITARKKQYEYYRNKLLTFKEAV